MRINRLWTARIVVSLSFTLMLSGLASFPLRAETLTLRDAMLQAVKNNPNLQAAGFETAARVDEQRSVRGRFLPGVRTSANVLYWNDDASSQINLSAITDIFSDLAPMLPASSQEKLANLQNNPPEIQIRDRLTYKASITIAQPLIQLYGMYFNYDAAGKLAEAAALDQRSARLQLEFEVARAYYGLLAAIGMTETLGVALRQIDAYESRAKVLLDAGRIEANALMQVEVQRAEMSKAIFAAQKGVLLGKARLNMLMGRPQDIEFEPEMMGEMDIAGAEGEASVEWSDEALRERPDLLAAGRTVEAAKARRHAAIASMLPELNAVFTYDYNGGMGAMQPENQYFVGLTLNWNLWDWGASYYQFRAVKSRADGAARRLEGLKEQAQLEIRSRLLDVDEAERGYGVAVLARGQAAENLRIETVRYDAGRATTADLLSAQAIDVRAANDLVLAEMKLRESRQALFVTAGRDLLD